MLKNRYLISVLTFLSRRSFLLSKLFETRCANPLGIVLVWVCLNGIWTIVAADEKLPVFSDFDSEYHPFNIKTHSLIKNEVIIL